MSYVERSIAMATAENWQEYAKILQRIISRNGSRDFLERNFFTTTQWIPNNSWLLEDVTDDVAGKYVAYFDAVTWPKQFYSKLRFGQNDTPIGRAKAAAQEAKVRLLPEKAVVTMSYMPIFRAARSTDIQNGDLLLIVREMRKEGLAPWLDIDHMGIAVREPGQGLSIAHCVLAGAKLQTLEDFRAAYPQVVGVKVLRIRPNIQEQIAREIERMPDIEPID